MNLVKHDSLKRYGKDLVWQRHVDRYTSGIADVELVYRGQTIWVEFKWLTKIPKKPRPLMSNTLVAPLQVRFLEQRDYGSTMAFVCFGFPVTFGGVNAVWIEGAQIRTGTTQLICDRPWVDNHTNGGWLGSVLA